MQRARFLTPIIAVVAALLLIGPVAVSTAAAAPPPDAGTIPGAYIVSLRSGDPSAVAAEHGRTRDARVDFVYRHSMRGYAARMPSAAAARLREDPRVASVVPDRRVEIAAQTVPAGIARIGATRSSTTAGDGRGTVDADIAILDTGIDTRNRDLNVVGGVNCVPGGLSYADRNGHGTHVAGIAAARDDNGGVVGVAPGARLWAVRVLTSQGAGTWSSIICGIDWVTANAGTLEVANMSLGGAGGEGSCTDGGMRQAICGSVAAGVTYVVAAGNGAADANSFVPAAYPEVITVSAIADFDGRPGGLGSPNCSSGRDDAFASFSNNGPEVDLTAPGVCVRSTWPGGTATLSGTSMASPHVAGAAALYLSRHPGTRPAAVRSALIAAGTYDWTGDRDGITEPLVNVAAF